MPPPPVALRSLRLAGLLAVVLGTGACGQGELEIRSGASRAGTAGDDGTPTGGHGQASGGAHGGPGGESAPNGATGGDSAGGDDPAVPERPLAPFAPSASLMPRLTASQYRNTLADLFGEDLPRTPVEPDTNPYLFHSIGAATTELSERGVEQYGEAAFVLAEAVFADPNRLARVLDCAPTASDDACIDAFIRGVGRRLYRRPLDEEEVARWLSVSRDTAEGDPARGAETVLAGMLQSPSFLYRAEQGEPVPGGDATMYRYTAWEMAGRLAFLVTDSGPDDTLLDAAERGELDTPDQLAAQAERLLESPRAREAVQNFFAQYLDLGRLAQVDLDPAVYPGFSRGLVRAMETEVRLLVDDLVFRRRADIRGLFSAPRGYVNRDLAALYAIDAPGATATAFVPVSFGNDIPRAGLLTLGAFLTMNAHRTETSPTLRGKFIRERVLCQEVPPPPANVNLDLARGEGQPPTLRERLEEHRKNPVCAGCHAFIDPPGFLFEHYDSMGRYRDAVDGYPVNSSGDLDGKPLDDALDLARVLADDPQVGKCMVRQLYRFANSRLDTRTDRAALRALEEAFAASGHDFRALLLALVRSDGFRLVAAPDAAADAADPANPAAEDSP